MYTKQQLNLAVPLLEDYIKRFPEDADVHRLRLALAVVQTQKRPRYGLQILRQIKPEYLSDDNRSIYEQTIALARQLIEEGTIELPGESWD